MDGMNRFADAAQAVSAPAASVTDRFAPRATGAVLPEPDMAVDACARTLRAEVADAEAAERAEAAARERREEVARRREEERRRNYERERGLSRDIAASSGGEAMYRSIERLMESNRYGNNTSASVKDSHRVSVWVPREFYRHLGAFAATHDVSRRALLELAYLALDDAMTRYEAAERGE